MLFFLSQGKGTLVTYWLRGNIADHSSKALTKTRSWNTSDYSSSGVEVELDRANDYNNADGRE